MKITTESGSVYEIDSRGVCVKKDSEGKKVDAFKVFSLKPVPDNLTEWAELLEIPNSRPSVGKRMYISGLNTYWISTAVVRVEEDDIPMHPPLTFRDKSAGE
jgi:hypothetical protein